MASKRTLCFHEVVGRGGFGTVYRATLTAGGGFRKEVAVKVLHDQGDHDDQVTERLRDEARLLGLVRHRALASVDGLYWVEGRWALVTEYVHGVSLLQATQAERIPVGVTLEIGAEVASALHAAYAAPGPDGSPLCLIHRDIKPANIQLTQAGEVKLLDLGIARADYAGREAETEAVLLGSVTYMAPERLELVSGPESDVYALAVSLVEAVTARKLGRTSAHPERHDQHIQVAMEKLREWVQDPVMEAFEVLLREMLSYEASDRPVAREVERRLRELRRTAAPPWLPDWAEQHLDPDEQVDPLGDPILGRTLVALDGPEAVAVHPIRRALIPLGIFAVALAAVFVVGVGAVLWNVVGTVEEFYGVGGEPADATTTTAPAPRDAIPEDVVPEEHTGAEAIADAHGEDADLVGPPVATPSDAGAASPVAPMAPVGPPRPAPAPSGPDLDPGSPDRGPPAIEEAGGLILASGFAAWLKEHPGWAPTTAIAEGRADPLYLRDWTDGEPPPGQTWAVGVSWAAASAYCAGHGGLAPLGASPSQWSEASGPVHEWRTADGGPAWRRYDAATSTVVRKSDANAFTGFRCVQ